MYPEKALRLAISMGGDSDTIGAMTASIAGAERFNKCQNLLTAKHRKHTSKKSLSKTSPAVQDITLKPEKITQFKLARDNKAWVSDDTQMTLFTACGMLMGITRGSMRGIGDIPENYVDLAYLDWYYTLTDIKRKIPEMGILYTWIRDLPELMATVTLLVPSAET